MQLIYFYLLSLVALSTVSANLTRDVAKGYDYYISEDQPDNRKRIMVRYGECVSTPKSRRIGYFPKNTNCRYYDDPKCAVNKFQVYQRLPGFQAMYHLGDYMMCRLNTNGVVGNRKDGW